MKKLNYNYDILPVDYDADDYTVWFWEGNLLMVTEQHIIDILNDLLEKDQSSMIALLSLVVPTTSKVLEDYDVRFGSRSSDYPQLGLITILNKMIEDSGKRIKFKYNCDPISMEMEPSCFALVDH